MRLIINGYKIELSSSTNISRTLQVNDIIELENRQANYSATFKIPKTANNVRAFNFLGVNGNTSNVPYQRNEAYLYSDSEECLVYKGWAIIKETSDNYSVNVLDGNIDLYKSIENLTLSDLDLTEANHFKTLTNVINSFDDSTVYKYILADYNGKALYDTDKINIDYLTPSIPISYLWDKIFNTYGFTYEGQAFNTFAFQNLYLTYPKGTLEETPTPEAYYTNDYTNLESNEEVGFETNVKHNNITTVDGQFLSNDVGYVAPTEGTYIIESDLDLRVSGEDQISGTSSYVDWELHVLVNGVDNGILTSGSINYGNSPIYLQLNAGDIVSLQVHANNIILGIDFLSGDVSYNFLSGFDVDFNETFIDFKTKDFLKEVLNRFGLTPFKDKYSNNYRFLTLTELLQEPNIEDWSSYENKFQSLNSESYVYGSYAQQNNFVYKYNDDEADYYNGSISIDNVNLADSKDVVKSNIYAPEKLPSNELQKQTNIYKLWNKEVKDDGSVTYKGLEKRFYLMRSEDYAFENDVIIGSEVLQTETTISTAPFESFFKLKFSEIIEDFYKPLSQILDKARIINASIYLNDLDVQNINFSSLKWIKDLNSYFLLNKVSNYSKKGVQKTELIKVDYVNTFYTSPIPININSYVGGCIQYTCFGQSFLKMQFSNDNGLTWSPVPETPIYNFEVGNGEICGLTLTSGTLIRFINNVFETRSNIFLIP